MFFFFFGNGKGQCRAIKRYCYNNRNFEVIILLTFLVLRFLVSSYLLPILIRLLYCKQNRLLLSILFFHSNLVELFLAIVVHVCKKEKKEKCHNTTAPTEFRACNTKELRCHREAFAVRKVTRYAEHVYCTPSVHVVNAIKLSRRIST